MAGFFGGAPPKQIKPAERDDAEVQEAAARARRRARRRRGSRASIISRNIPAGSAVKQTFGE